MARVLLALCVLAISGLGEVVSQPGVPQVLRWFGAARHQRHAAGFKDHRQHKASSEAHLWQEVAQTATDLETALQLPVNGSGAWQAAQRLHTLWKELAHRRNSHGHDVSGPRPESATERNVRAQACSIIWKEIYVAAEKFQYALEVKSGPNCPGVWSATQRLHVLWTTLDDMDCEHLPARSGDAHEVNASSRSGQHAVPLNRKHEQQQGAMGRASSGRHDDMRQPAKHHRHHGLWHKDDCNCGASSPSSVLDSRSLGSLAEKTGISPQLRRPHLRHLPGALNVSTTRLHPLKRFFEAPTPVGTDAFVHAVIERLERHLGLQAGTWNGPSTDPTEHSSSVTKDPSRAATGRARAAAALGQPSMESQPQSSTSQGNAAARHRQAASMAADSHQHPDYGSPRDGRLAGSIPAHSQPASHAQPSAIDQRARSAQQSARSSGGTDGVEPMQRAGAYDDDKGKGGAAGGGHSSWWSPSTIGNGLMALLIAAFLSYLLPALWGLLSRPRLPSANREVASKSQPGVVDSVRPHSSRHCVSTAKLEPVSTAGSEASVQLTMMVQVMVPTRQQDLLRKAATAGITTMERELKQRRQETDFAFERHFYMQPLSLDATSASSPVKQHAENAPDVEPRSSVPSTFPSGRPASEATSQLQHEQQQPSGGEGSEGSSSTGHRSISRRGSDSEHAAESSVSTGLHSSGSMPEPSLADERVTQSEDVPKRSTTPKPQQPKSYAEAVSKTISNDVDSEHSGAVSNADSEVDDVA